MADTTPSSDSGFAGWQFPSNALGMFNQIDFHIKQVLGLRRTLVPCKVISCTTAGQVGPVGFVNVQPLVAMMDGSGNLQQHGVIAGLPYTRLTGGDSSVICDPVADDLGYIMCADRDISAVKANKDVAGSKRGMAGPGSFRRSDLADGVYVGGMLNPAPSQWVRFSSTGIEIADRNGNTIEMTSTGITINGVLFDQSQNVSAVANLTTTGDASLGGGSKKIVLDGDTVSGGHVVASSTKSRAT